MKYYLQQLIDGHDLSMVESEAAMGQILESATDAQVGAFVMGMKMKGETPDEVAGFAKGMLKVANMIRPKVDGILVDTCGTGGGSTQYY